MWTINVTRWVIDFEPLTLRKEYMYTKICIRWGYTHESLWSISDSQLLRIRLSSNIPEELAIGNGLIKLFWRQDIRCARLLLCSNRRSFGSTPTAKLIAKAIANTPQSAVPLCWCTLTVLISAFLSSMT